jgi:LacI family transcriptional regulator/LacI family repressor for deo operon, udp, cdd, tsx, nupC, and nupG
VLRAFSASHVAFPKDGIVTAGAHLEDGYRAGLALFRERPADARPTAITCYNDLVAVGLYRALAELGLRVPQDVSVIGFDDIPLCQYLPVPLTTVPAGASNGAARPVAPTSTPVAAGGGG